MKLSVLLLTFSISIASAVTIIAADDDMNLRAPRTDAQLPTDPQAIAGNSCDLTKVLELLAIIRSRIGNVFQEPGKRTVLSTLGDPVELGPGLNIVRKLLLLQQDFSGVFTSLLDIKTTLTECCEDLHETITTCCSDVITTVTLCCEDLHETITTCCADVIETVTTCCAEIQVNFNGTFTILADLSQTLTTCCSDILETVTTCCADILVTLTDCCAQIQNNFNGTFTVLNDIRVTITECCEDLHETITTCCADVIETVTTCCAEIQIDFNGAFTVLADLSQTLTTCCSDILETVTTCCAEIQVNFDDTFTFLTDIRITLTTCCDTLEQDLIGVFTVIAVIAECCNNIDIDLAGVFTVLEECCSCNPTPIASAPFTITSPGVYCLESDVTVPNGSDGITISASNVVLDLNGHTINGTLSGIGTRAGNGVLVSGGFNDISIKNGTILRFAQGINAPGSNERMLVEYITTATNGHGIFLGTVDGAFVRNFRIYRCQSYTNVADGIHIDRAFDGLIESCLTSDNDGTGIQLATDTIPQGANILINDCNSTTNLSAGINVEPQLVGILNCIANGNVVQGIRLGVGTLNCYVRHNTVTANASFGIENTGAAGPNGNRIYLNYASGNNAGGAEYSGVAYTADPSTTTFATPISYAAWVSNTFEVA